LWQPLGGCPLIETYIYDFDKRKTLIMRKKLRLVFLVVVLTPTLIFAQTKSRKWGLGLSGDFVDYSALASGSGSAPLDRNNFNRGGKLTVSRYLNRHFVAFTSASVANLDNANIPSVTLAPGLRNFLDWDFGLQYKIVSSLVKEDSFTIDPYLFASGGYNVFSQSGGMLYSGGLGLKVWFKRDFALHFQTSYNATPSIENATSFLQHSVGLYHTIRSRDKIEPPKPPTPDTLVAFVEPKPQIDTLIAFVVPKPKDPDPLPPIEVPTAFKDWSFDATGIKFEFGKSTFTKPALNVMKALADSIKSLPDSLQFEVDAHTDSVDTYAYNVTLSKARAQAVVDYLVKSGIRREKLHPFAWGEIRPMATNSTAEGRQLNRRVEIHLYGKSPLNIERRMVYRDTGKSGTKETLSVSPTDTEIKLIQGLK
jgi:outer membrane protein OmpA-like peptidoglycan-associated protein